MSGTEERQVEITHVVKKGYSGGSLVHPRFAIVSSLAPGTANVPALRSPLATRTPKLQKIALARQNQTSQASPLPVRIWAERNYFTHSSPMLMVAKPHAPFPVILPLPIPLSARRIVEGAGLVLLDLARKAYPAPILVTAAVIREAPRQIALDLLVARRAVADDRVALIRGIEMGLLPITTPRRVPSARHVSTFLCFRNTQMI